MSTAKSDESIASKLKDRILALIPDRPEILTLNSAWDLLKIEGFDCGDMGPRLAQAEWALEQAKREWNAWNATHDNQ